MNNILLYFIISSTTLSSSTLRKFLIIFYIGFDSGNGVPEPDGLVLTAGDESARIGAVKQDLLYTASVAFECQLKQDHNYILQIMTV